MELINLSRSDHGFDDAQVRFIKVAEALTRKVKAHALFVMNSCHSGAAEEPLRSIVRRYVRSDTHNTNPRSIELLASCESDEMCLLSLRSRFAKLWRWRPRAAFK